MYFLRWIAGYPILIILLVVGLYALYNKDNFSHWFDKNEAGVQTTELGHVEEQVASTVEKVTPLAEIEVEAESKRGSWLDIFKGRKTETETASLPVLEEQEVVTTEAVTSGEVVTETVEEEGKSGSWLDIFKGRKAETEVASVPAQEEQTTVAAESTSSAEVEMAKSEEGRFGEQMMEAIPPMSEMGEIPPMPELSDIPPMPEMKDFPPMEPFPEMPMESAFIPQANDSVAIMAPAADDNAGKADTEVIAETSDATEGKSGGSWLDIFKGDKTETEEALPPAQQDAPVAATEVEPAANVETAKVEEEKSGSWLDIFKRNKEEPSSENSAGASPEFQSQQNESLRLAREAFWQRDFDAAEAIYTNMTKAEPENAGLLGEYGNVLLEAGKMGQALDVYEQVAELLIAEGRTFELRPLLYFIGDQDPERAHKLTQKIQAQQETNN